MGQCLQFDKIINKINKINHVCIYRKFDPSLAAVSEGGVKGDED